MEKFVLYFLPEESDIWETILLRMQDTPAGSRRFAVPADTDEMYEEWHGASINCGASDYSRAFERFEESRLIGKVGPGNGKQVYGLLVNPEEFMIMRITERPTVPTNAVYVDIVRAIQAGELTLPNKWDASLFKEWVANSFGKVHPDTARQKIRGFSPDKLQYSWGIIINNPGGGLLTCWRGFESNEFELIDILHRHDVESINRQPGGNGPNGDAPVPEPVDFPDGSTTSPTIEEHMKTPEELEGLSEEDFVELLAHWTSVRDIAEGQIAGIADEKARRVTVKRDALQVKLNAIEQRKQ
ncbi:MAG: hypothetical protein ABIA47_01060, partial [bacterium]